MVLRLSLDKLNNEFVMNEIRYKKIKETPSFSPEVLNLLPPDSIYPLITKCTLFSYFKIKKVVCYIFSIRWLQIKVE